MYLVNYFGCDSNNDFIEMLSDFLGIDFDTISSFFTNNVYDEVTLLDMLEYLNISIDQIIKEDIRVVCRHGVNCFDELKSIKSLGLLTLSEVLSIENPISKFLEEHKIKIDVIEKKINYNSNEYEIMHYNDLCNQCIFEEKECKDFFGTRQLSMKSCEYREDLYRLHSKLYYDKGEVEVFIDGEIEDIVSYSSISYCPEILITLDDIIKHYRKCESLEYKWKEIGGRKFYVLEFDVPFTALERVKNKAYFKQEYQFYNLMEKMGYDQFEDDFEDIPEHLIVNYVLLNDLFNKAYNGSYEQYAQILPEYRIVTENIKCVHETVSRW